MLRALGADHLIDYEREDFTRSGRRYDLILDTKTNRMPWAYARVLAPGGIYATVGGSMRRALAALLLGPFISLFFGRHIKMVMLKPNKDLGYFGALFEAGKLRPVIDGPYELDEIAEAFRYYGTAAHKGKIVVTMG